MPVGLLEARPVHRKLAVWWECVAVGAPLQSWCCKELPHDHIVALLGETVCNGPYATAVPSPNVGAHAEHTHRKPNRSEMCDMRLA